jgi:cytochrome P450
MLLFAGHETTRNLLGNGLHALLTHREQWRLAAEMVLHGQQLRRGDLVVALIGAANRDPSRFEQPDSLDITRSRHNALSFGSGPMCASAPRCRRSKRRSCSANCCSAGRDSNCRTRGLPGTATLCTAA